LEVGTIKSWDGQYTYQLFENVLYFVFKYIYLFNNLSVSVSIGHVILHAHFPYIYFLF